MIRVLCTPTEERAALTEHDKFAGIRMITTGNESKVIIMGRNLTTSYADLYIDEGVKDFQLSLDVFVTYCITANFAQFSSILFCFSCGL